MRIYFFLLLSADCKFAQFILHWQGIFPLFRFSAVGHGFFAPYYRGGKEDERGRKRRQEETGGG